MPIFISYNRKNAEFVDQLAANLVARKHHIWMDRWELNIGDSLIDKIQGALTESSAILIVLSKDSVASEWCRKELNSGLTRELSEKKVLLLPCVIDDCSIPLFLQDKLYADFRSKPDEAIKQVSDALLRITNLQQGRLESPDFHTDWAYDWKKGKNSGLWYFDWVFIDHGSNIEYSAATRCQLACNPAASFAFDNLSETAREEYIRATLKILLRNSPPLKLIIKNAFEVDRQFFLDGPGGEGWLVEISSRRLGIDNGKDTLMHVDQMLERALIDIDARMRQP